MGDVESGDFNCLPEDDIWLAFPDSFICQSVRVATSRPLSLILVIKDTGQGPLIIQKVSCLATLHFNWIDECVWKTSNVWIRNLRSDLFAGKDTMNISVLFWSLSHLTYLKCQVCVNLFRLHCCPFLLWLPMWFILER